MGIDRYEEVADAPYFDPIYEKLMCVTYNLMLEVVDADFAEAERRPRDPRFIDELHAIGTAIIYGMAESK